MDIQNVPKVGISSVVHSKHIDVDSIDVIDNDIAPVSYTHLDVYKRQVVCGRLRSVVGYGRSGSSRFSVQGLGFSGGVGVFPACRSV